MPVGIAAPLGSIPSGFEPLKEGLERAPQILHMALATKGGTM